MINILAINENKVRFKIKWYQTIFIYVHYMVFKKEKSERLKKRQVYNRRFVYFHAMLSHLPQTFS